MDVDTVPHEADHADLRLGPGDVLISDTAAFNASTASGHPRSSTPSAVRR